MSWQMRAAFEVAMFSPDLSTQNGAIIASHGPSQGLVVGWGCNTLPNCVNVTDERLERPAKYLYTEHAERNAIYQAAKSGYATEGATMYALWAACADCARAIIQAGITRLCRHEFYQTAENAKWSESIAAGDEMLKEAGIEIREWKDPVMYPNQSLLFNGKQVNF